MNIEQDRRIQHLVFVLVRVFDVYLFLIRHVRVDYFPVEIVDHVHHINAVHLVFHVCLPLISSALLIMERSKTISTAG